MITLPILYHGTDVRLIQMSKTSLHSYIKDCNKVVDALWTIIKPLNEEETVKKIIYGETKYVCEKKVLRHKDALNRYSANLYFNILERMIMLEARDNRYGLYQYGHLYLTSCKEKAENYALNSFGGGEIGTTAYRMIQTVEALGLNFWETDKDLLRCVENVKAFATADKKPVIIPVENLDIQYLINEDGSILDYCDAEMLPQDFRYTKEIQLTLNNANYLYKDTANLMKEIYSFEVYGVKGKKIGFCSDDYLTENEMVIKANGILQGATLLRSNIAVKVKKKGAENYCYEIKYGL